MTDTLERVEEEQPQQTPARKKRSRWRSMLFLTIAGALVLVASGVLPVQQFLERETQVNAANERLAQLVAENSEIASDVEALSTDQELERIAREQYGFVREGEVGYSVIMPESDNTTVAESEAPAEDVEDPGFLGRIWRFVTGGDVVDDG